MFRQKPAFQNEALSIWTFPVERVIAYRTTGSKMSTDLAQLLATQGDILTFELIEVNTRKLHAIFDWSSIESYDFEARKTLLAWAHSRRDVIESIDMCISPKASIFLRIAVTTGAGIITMAGTKFDVHDQIVPALRKFNVSDK
jgi:hypothetical protein